MRYKVGSAVEVMFCPGENSVFRTNENKLVGER